MKSDFCPATKADSAIKGNCVCSAANTATDASLANAIPGVNTDNALDNAPAMQVNIAKTRQYYLSLRQEDLCDCAYCCCYCNQVRTAYPNLAAWLDSLGIAIEKPFEASALEPDENGRHIFGYFGVPDEFKIIIVTESGQIKVSDVIKRKTMEISLTLDCNDMSHTSKPVWTAYIAQFAITFSVTIAVEFIVLAIFFMARKANLKPFLHMNIITQLLLTAFMSTGFIYGGTIIAYMWFPVIELVIFIFEMWYSKKYFIGENDLMKLAYAFVANTASAMLTFFSLETIMDIMFKVIR